MEPIGHKGSNNLLDSGVQQKYSSTFRLLNCSLSLISTKRLPETGEDHPQAESLLSPKQISHSQWGSEETDHDANQCPADGHPSTVEYQIAFFGRSATARLRSDTSEELGPQCSACTASPL
jgi:hypothetical protein